ncbi:MAG: MMPL family transporter [Planctomycetes bacterium]|nr:MMPL family transporter [Planctomycetota bacterium]
MDLETEPRDEPGLLSRSLAGAVCLVCAHPWIALGLTLLSCVICGQYTWNNLAYLTHRNDLISSKKDYLKRWHQYLEEFGDDDDMIVVVQGNDRTVMENTLEEIAGEIQQQPESFERLFYKVDLRALHSRALLFLPTDQIRQIQGHIQGMSLLLEPPVLGTLDPWFGWRSLSVQQLLRESERRLSAWKTDQANTEAQKFFTQLAPICVAASDYLESPSRYRNPWQSSLPAPSEPKGAGSNQEEQLAKPRYFFSTDGKLAFLMVSPMKDEQSEEFNYSEKSIAALRAIVARVQARHAQVEIGLTGLPVLENDEMVASRDDSNFAAWLALIGVALLYLVVYRGVRYPFMTVAGLMVGTVWALGWLTLTVGHLNILSSAFAVMLIGMGDYGVLWVTRFGQERQAGLDIAQANRQTALHVGPSIFTAAVTTAASFFAAMLADLKAVSELGWIAGCGVLMCALSCFIVVPALLTILDFRMASARKANPMILSMREHREANREWLSWLMWKPRWVLAFSTLTTLVLLGFAVGIDYDHNLLNMQAPGLESVKWEKKLIEHMTGSSWYAVSWTTTPEEALALKAKYEKLPEVSQVITVASMIPTDQDRKLEMLRDLQQRLRNLPRRGEILRHAPANLDDIDQTGTRVIKTLTRLQKEKPNDSLACLQAGITSLVNTIRERRKRENAVPAVPGSIVQASHHVPAGSLKQHLREFDEQIARDLADDLHRLREVSAPTPIQLSDLPACVRERYIGKNGKWLLRVFSKDCLWNFEPLARFIQQVRTVDPEATGKPFTTLEGLKAMQSGFLWAGFYALIAMVLVLLLDFGRLKHTLVALLPLAMGMTAALGFMALFHVPLNPANMIAFPLILGVGADNGVHVLHDFRSRDRTRRYRLSHATGRGIMVAALTTILGFGTLMLATHRGMASLGLILTLGVTCCMATALVFLPALLYVLGRREKPDNAMATLSMQVRDAA